MVSTSADRKQFIVMICNFRSSKSKDRYRPVTHRNIRMWDIVQQKQLCLDLCKPFPYPMVVVTDNQETSIVAE